MRYTVIVFGAAIVLGFVLFRHSSDPAVPASAEEQNGGEGGVGELYAPEANALPARNDVASIAGLGSSGGEGAVLPASSRAGVVVQESGIGLSGVDVYLAGLSTGSATQVATSASQGVFSFTSDAPGELYAQSRSYAPVARTRFREKGSTVTVVVAPASRLAGLVTDEAGLALDGAQVVVQTTEAARRSWVALSSDLVPYVWEVRTDGGGRFALEGVAESGGRYATVSHEGHVTDHTLLPVPFPQDLVIVLRRQKAGRMAGRVVDAGMNPLQGTVVSCDEATASTDDKGWFSIGLTEATGSAPTKITALHPGFLPAMQELSAASLASGGEVLFVLEKGELSVEGTVVDSLGQGVQGAVVWSFDRTGMGAHDAADGTMVFSTRVTAEDVLGGGAGVVTTAGGRFRLGGLADRKYDLFAMSPDLRVGSVVGVPVGARNTTITVSADGEAYPLAGRVVTNRQGVVPGALVQVSRDFIHTTGSLLGRRELDLRSVTDEAGTFDFGVVYPEGLSLQVTAAGYGPYLGLPLPNDSQEIEIELFLRRSLQVDARALPSAQAVALLDKHGKRILFRRDFGETEITMAVERLVSGRTAVLKTTEEAVTIEIIGSDGTSTEHPLEFTNDSVTIVRL
jgi:hypothetical protein